MTALTSFISQLELKFEQWYEELQSEEADFFSSHTDKDQRVAQEEEITEHSLRAISALQKNGVIVVNQTPILKGINSNPDELAELLDKLSFAGVTPYYFFQNRPRFSKT